MSSEALREISLELDERNLAHVLSGVAFAATISRIPEARPNECTCWWDDREFRLKSAIDESTLLNTVDSFLRRIRWIPGIGGKDHGTFTADGEVGSNPFISLADDGQRSSPFKTFSANQEPAKDLLDKQREVLRPANGIDTWLTQIARGISSWGFDSRVGSHAYDLGFSSNDEGTGDRDPIYPAVELLSIAAASCFTSIHGWQEDEGTVGYAIWPQPLPVSLVSYAVAGRLDGLPVRRYRVATRGGAYGEGAKFRFFPEAVSDNNQSRRKYERRKKNR